MILYLSLCIEGNWKNTQLASPTLGGMARHLRLKACATWVVFEIDTGQINADKVCLIWNRACPNEWKKQSWRILVDAKSVLRQVDETGKDIGPMPIDEPVEE